MPIASLLAAGAATLAVAVSGQPAAFSITASPAHVSAGPGTIQVIRVTDSGTQPMLATASIMAVRKAGGRCTVSPAATPGVRLTGRKSFALQPGQIGRAHVTISRHAPAQDLAVVFTSSATRHGNVRVAGAVAARLVVTGRGHASHCVSASTTAQTPAGPGSSLTPLAYGVVALAAVALLAATVVLLRRLRQRPRGKRGAARR